MGFHESVLLLESIKALDIKPGRWYLDATLGDGGHSLEILRLGGKVVGLDVDPEALKRARRRLEGLGFRDADFRLIQGNFRDIDDLIDKQTDPKFKGILFDLGVSSLQLETPSRGFSFGKVGPLDMRMDPNLAVRAVDLLQVLSRKELHELFASLAEEKLAGPIADAVVRARKITGIVTTKDLSDLVDRVYKQHGIRTGRIHPATKVFQALRITVNTELEAIKLTLPKALERLEKNGNIVIISFHSLEDRIVKDAFKNWQLAGLGQVVSAKPTTPNVTEIFKNPRARSAKMRVFRKK